MTANSNKPDIKVFQIHLDDFFVLGNENIISASSDFGHIWDNFFKMGGYDPILPYAEDSKPVNLWYSNSDGQDIYLQGLFAENTSKIPEGYRLLCFPGSDFLVITTDWMSTNEEAVGENGNARCNRYAKTVQIPDGYMRNDGPGSPLTLIEKENADTPEGSRYEVWVPIIEK